MSYRELLERLRRIWRWSVVVTVASFYGPILTSYLFWARPRVIIAMEPLGGENHFADPIRWVEWTIPTSAICCLACAVFALATGVTYLIARRLPDFSDLTSGP